MLLAELHELREVAAVVVLRVMAVVARFARAWAYGIRERTMQDETVAQRIRDGHLADRVEEVGQDLQRREQRYDLAPTAARGQRREHRSGLRV